jgi:S1-C subfamily serine protease
MTTGYPYGYYPPPPPQQPAPPPRRGRDLRALASGFAAGALAAAVAFGGFAAIDASGPASVAGTGSIAQAPTLPTTPGPGSLFPSGNSGSASAGSVPATAQQQVGIVTVVSVLKYQNAESAGTGMILTSDGEVLTNNHVVDGATKIVVTVESTGRQYVAKVVGTAPTRDVAVLKLLNATGMQTAELAGSSADLSVGDTVVGVGNAGGTGRLTAAQGKVTALNQTITASDESGSSSERLHGLIETDADIISGDSGGPLYDDQGQIVGMDTAANATGTSDSAYAIPVEDAMGVVHQIESGVETSSIHIGLPGFLGIGLEPKSTRVQSLLPGGPAASAGIRPGSTITSVDGTVVHTATQLHNLLSAKGPGASVVVKWTAANKRARAATVTLATGPAD